MMLDKIIAECGLVCPYDDELVSDLGKACNSYFESYDLDESLFSEWVICYINGTCSPDIKDFVKDYAQAHDLGTLDFPDCVWCALNFYFIYTAIMDNDSDDEKAICSCSLQNMLLSCKGSWDSLDFQDCLVELYGEINQYLDENEEGSDDVSLTFISSLFDASFSFELDDNNLACLKSMGKYTWLYKLEHFVDSMSYTEEKSPFLRVLYFLDYWYKENPCIYFKIGAKQLLDIVKVEKYKSKKSIREIVSSLVATEKVLFDSPNSKSSLIIRMINERKIESASFVDEKLTCAEFFVYLYYELLLELKLKENAGE